MNNVIEAAKALLAKWDNPEAPTSDIAFSRLRTAVHLADWQPIDTAPSGKAILVYYKTPYGKSRIIKARRIEAFTEEATDYEYENDLNIDYDEKNDKYYAKAGWIEMIDNWDEYNGVYFNQPLTHWMLLPEPPVKEK